MPVTAKLSRKFYERFGDEIAGELVDWFNAVDLTYQTQLKEINELNWERFKAALQAESAAIRGELREEFRGGLAGIEGALRGVEGSLRTEMAELRGELRGGLAGIEGALRGVEGSLRTEMAELRGELRGGLTGAEGSLRGVEGALRTEMAEMRADLRTEMAEMRADLLKWMFVYWTGTVVTLGGLIVGMAMFGPR